MPGNLGCFKDSGDPPTLSGTSETSNKLTIQNCISFCRKQRYKVRRDVYGAASLTAAGEILRNITNYRLLHPAAGKFKRIKQSIVLTVSITDAS